MKVLITGGSGFLGRVTARLMRRAGYDVTILCRGNYKFLADEDFSVISGDVCDRTFLKSVFSGFDEVHHIASLTGISMVKSPFYRTNVEGTRNVIEACLKNKVRKLVYTSSPSVVFDGKSDEMVDESTPYPKKFLNPYSETKAEAENKQGKIKTTKQMSYPAKLSRYFRLVLSCISFHFAVCRKMGCLSYLSGIISI